MLFCVILIISFNLLTVLERGNMKKEIELMNNHLSKAQDKLDLVLSRSLGIIHKFTHIKIKKDTNVFLIGNGSSGIIAKHASYFFLELFKKAPIFINPYEFVHYHIHTVNENDIVIGISQTGSSHFVVEALKLCNERNVQTIALTTIRNSPVTQVSKSHVILEECVENVDYKIIGVIGLLYGLLYVFLGFALGNNLINGSDVNYFINNLKILNSQFDEISSKGKTWVDNNISILEKSSSFIFLGSGPLVSIAEEMAMKTVEIINHPSNSNDIEEFLHGYSATNPIGLCIFMFVDRTNHKFAKRVFKAMSKKHNRLVWIGFNSPFKELSIDFFDQNLFSSLNFFPLVYSILVEWALLLGYGNYGSEIFKYYQNNLKVRNE